MCWVNFNLTLTRPTKTRPCFFKDPIKEETKITSKTEVYIEESDDGSKHCDALLDKSTESMPFCTAYSD